MRCRSCAVFALACLLAGQALAIRDVGELQRRARHHDLAMNPTWVPASAGDGTVLDAHASSLSALPARPRSGLHTTASASVMVEPVLGYAELANYHRRSLLDFADTAGESEGTEYSGDGGANYVGTVSTISCDCEPGRRQRGRWRCSPECNEIRPQGCP